MSDEKPPAEGRDRERPNDQRPIRPKVNYATVSEAALVDAMRTGEARAIEEFIVRYQRLLIDRARTAGLRPRDCADAIADVVPDVAMRVVARRLAAAQAFFRTFRRNLTARLSPEGPPADKEPEDQRANEGSAAARGTPGPCPDPNNPACKKGGTMTINVGGAAAFLAFGGNLEMGVAFNRSGDLLLYVKGGVSYGLGVAGGPEIGVNRGSLDDVTARTGYEGGGFEFAGAGGIASGSVTISEEGRIQGGSIGTRGPAGAFLNMTNFGWATPTVNIPDLVSQRVQATKLALSQVRDDIISAGRAAVAAMRCPNGCSARQ